MSHPLPFMKASNVTATARSTKEMPDLEEAIEEEDDEALVEPKVEDEEEELDILKDKYIKQPKTKKLPVGKVAVKSRKTSRDVEDADESEEIKPKKARMGRSKGATMKAKVKT
jgi:replication factor C subunit 1